MYKQLVDFETWAYSPSGKYSGINRAIWDGLYQSPDRSARSRNEDIITAQRWTAPHVTLFTILPLHQRLINTSDRICSWSSIYFWNSTGWSNHGDFLLHNQKNHPFLEFFKLRAISQPSLTSEFVLKFRKHRFRDVKKKNWLKLSFVHINKFTRHY